MKTRADDDDHRATRPAGARWLRALFFIAARWPGWLLRIRPLVAHGAYWLSPHVRRATAANARRLFQPAPRWRAHYRYARGVVANFFTFVIDVAAASARPVEQIEAGIIRVEGATAYRACRATCRGAVLVTAHMGSFEVGLAALCRVESNVHVVFKRDASSTFESLRSALRARLGVHEAAIDDGWPTLMRLRAALEADEVIVMQGDRASPGQRAQVVPFRFGHLALPVGPATLARLVGSPIVPVFTVREPDGRFVVHLLAPIVVDADAPSVEGIDPAVRAIAAAIESFVAQRPEQWLVLEPAFLEDRARVVPTPAER